MTKKQQKKSLDKFFKEIESLDPKDILVHHLQCGCIGTCMGHRPNNTKLSSIDKVFIILTCVLVGLFIGRLVYGN